MLPLRINIQLPAIRVSYRFFQTPLSGSQSIPPALQEVIES